MTPTRASEVGRAKLSLKLIRSTDRCQAEITRLPFPSDWGYSGQGKSGDSRHLAATQWANAA